jgi:hypothetical protein
MNEIQLIQELKNNPDFLSDDVEWIKIEDFDYDKFEKDNDVRISSHLPKARADMKESIKKYGVIVPIEYELKAGNVKLPTDGWGRIGLCLELKSEALNIIANPKTSEEDRGLWSKVVERVGKVPGKKVSCKNRPHKRKKSVIANMHLPSSSATNDDIADAVHRNINDGDLPCGTQTADVTPEMVREYLLTDMEDFSKFPNGGMGLDSLHGKRINSIVQKVIDKLPYDTQKFMNWASRSDREVVEKFNSTNPYGLTLELNDQENFTAGSVFESSIDGQKYSVYFCKQETYARQNIVHYSLGKRLQDPEVKVLMVAYNGSNLTVTKGTTDPVSKFRQNVGRIVAEWNNHPAIAVNIVDELAFLPQYHDKDDFNFLYSEHGNPVT